MTRRRPAVSPLRGCVETLRRLFNVGGGPAGGAPATDLAARWRAGPGASRRGPCPSARHRHSSAASSVAPSALHRRPERSEGSAAGAGRLRDDREAALSARGRATRPSQRSRRRTTGRTAAGADRSTASARGPGAAAAAGAARRRWRRRRVGRGRAAASTAASTRAVATGRSRAGPAPAITSSAPGRTSISAGVWPTTFESAATGSGGSAAISTRRARAVSTRSPSGPPSLRAASRATRGGTVGVAVDHQVELAVVHARLLGDHERGGRARRVADLEQQRLGPPGRIGAVEAHLDRARREGQRRGELAERGRPAAVLGLLAGRRQRGRQADAGELEERPRLLALGGADEADVDRAGRAGRRSGRRPRPGRPARRARRPGCCRCRAGRSRAGPRGRSGRARPPRRCRRRRPRSRAGCRPGRPAAPRGGPGAC